MENKTNWEVYKVDERGHSWKWVARDSLTNELFLFLTKKSALKFVQSQKVAN